MKKIYSFFMMMFLFGIINAQINLPFQSDFSLLAGSSATSGSQMPAMTAAKMPAGFLFASSTGLYEGGQKIKYGTSSAGGTLVSDVINTTGFTTIEVKIKAIAWPTTGAKTATINLTYGTQTKTVTAAGRTDWPVNNTDLIEYSCQFDAIATPTSLSIATIANTSSNESRIFLDDVRITGEGAASGIFLPFQSDFSLLDGSSATSGSQMPAMTAAKMPAGFLFASSTGLYQAGQKIKYGTSSAGGTLVSDVINTGSVSTIEVKFKAIAWPTTGAKTATINLTYGTQTKTITAAGRTDWPVNNTDLIVYSCQFDAIATPTSLSIATIANTSSNESRIFLDDVRIAAPTPITGIFLPFQSDFSGLEGASATSGSSMPAMTAAKMPEGFLFTSSTGLYQGGQKIKYGTASAGGTLVSDVINTGGIPMIEVKIKAIAWPTTGAKTATINLTYGTQTKTVTAAGRTDWPVTHADLIEYSCQFNAIATPTSLSIATIANTSSNESRIFLDDVRIAAPSVAQVATPTFNIPTGTYTTTQNITIDCATAGATIHYTTNGNNPTTTDATFTGTPIPVSVNTTIKAMAVKAGMDNSSVASATYTFPIEVANIGAFKTAHAALPPTGNNISNVPYKITGNVTYVERLGRNIYIKDATGGLLIFDNSPTSVITTTYNPGDVISGGVIGTCTRYNGMFEMIPLFNLAAGTPGAPVTPTVLTMSNLLANFSDYESQLVKLENITFGEAKTLGLSSTAAGANVAILQGTDEMILRNNYNTITGYTSNPNSMFHVTGFIVPYVTITANDKQICPRDFDDIFELEFTVTFKNWDNSVIANQTYHYGETVVPPANPTRPADLIYTYTFNGWSPAIVSPVVGNATYTATYSQTYINYILTVLAFPSTYGSVSGGGTTFHYGDPATISATANTGYHFVSWNDGNTSNPRTVTVTGNATYTAIFESNQYILTLNPTPGTIGTTSIPVYYGLPIGTIPEPNERPGYEFTGWYTGMNCAGTKITATTIWNTLGGLTVYACWKAKTYTLTLDPGTGTCATAEVTRDYNSAILPLPNAIQNSSYGNCTFLGWYIDNELVVAPGNNTWKWTENKTAYAKFECPIKVTVVGGTYGAVTPTSPTGTIFYPVGNNVTYDFKPVSPSAHVASVVINGKTEITGNPELSEDKSIDFTNIDKAYSVTVTFARNCYTPHVTYAPGTKYTMTVPPSTTPVSCVPYGSTAIFNFTSSGCSNITNINIGGDDQGPIATYTFPNVTAPLPAIDIQGDAQTFTINATVNDELMGTISYLGTKTWSCNEDPTYTISPEPGYRILSVLVDGVNIPEAVASESYTFTDLDANHTIHVVFEEIKVYIIQFGPDASQNAGGVVFPTNNPTAVYYIQVDDGTASVPFTILADNGFVIDKVYVDGYNIPAAVQSGSYEFKNINKSHTISATFKPIMFTINATSTVGGTINPPGAIQVPMNSQPTFTATADAGYHLVDILVDGIPASTPYTFGPVTADHTIHAIFAINTYTITPTAGANGNISPNTVQTVNHGTNKKFDFDPNTGYKVDKVFVDGNSNPAAAAAGNYTFYNIAGSHNIHVTFSKLVYTITSTAGANGAIVADNVVNGVEFVEYWNHSEIYVFNPDPGYHIKQVLIDGVNNPLAVLNGMYRFLNVAENHSIVVFFAKNEFYITATATQGGVINPAGLITVPSCTDRTFYFTPDPGYKLVRVVVDGINNELAVATGFYTFKTVSENHTISAQFERTTYTVTLPDVEGVEIIVTNGSSSSVNYNGTFTFEVKKLEGYEQSNILVRTNGVVLNLVGTEYKISNIKADQNVSIEGVNLNTYIITANAEPGGTISPKNKVAVTHGESMTFTITPSLDYVIENVLVNGESEGPVEFYTFNDIKANGTILAIFKYNPVKVDENEALINVFSNKNVVTIENQALIPVKQVEIMDMFGRVVWQGQTLGEKTDITLNVATGIYNVRIITENNEMTTTKVSVTK